MPTIRIGHQKEVRQLVRVAEALQTGVHVACIAEVLKANDAVPAISRTSLDAHFIELVISLGRARGQVEGLVLLTARLVAILYPLALAADTEDFALMAELALADLNTLHVFKHVGKLGIADLDDENFVREVELANDQLTADIWLDALARKLDPRVLFLLSRRRCFKP